ncbi:MAG: TIGR03545 family protein [Proteobacteria bacterium]|nr:TIGR03545 family protein [Pseudomonadota bacterium]
MKTWIRWKGILAFVVIMALVFGFFKFYAGTLVKKSIEYGGTKAVGARVDLGAVDLSLFPLGITLKGLQVTDPDEPMTNMVEVGTTRFSIEPGSLLLRKVIIDTMAVDDMRFKTARKYSGEIPKSKETKKDEKKAEGSKLFSMPSLEFSDVKSVLAKEPLGVVEEGDKLKKDMEKARIDFESRFMGLPDKETFEAHNDRLKELKSGKIKLGNILSKAEDLKNLKKDVEKDVEKIKAMKKDLAQAVDDYQVRIRQLPQMAAADVKRLKDKYALSPQGMGNVSALFFGPKSSVWVEKGLSWYLKLKPYLKKNDSGSDKEKEQEVPQHDRGKGVYVAFKEKNPSPGFLIKHADLSLVLDAGRMEGALDQVTNEQSLTGLPMTLSLASTEMKTMKGIKIVGVLDRVKKNEDKDALMLSVKDMNIDGLALASGSPMGVRMDKALADFDMNIKINGKKLEGTLAAALDPMTLNSLNPEKNDRLSRALSKALADVKAMKIGASLSGTVDDYKVNLESDLDKIVKNAVQGIVKDLSDEFAKELQVAVQEKIQGQIKDLTGKLDLYSNLGTDVEKRLDVGKETLKGL